MKTKKPPMPPQAITRKISLHFLLNQSPPDKAQSYGDADHSVA
ncbi:MAG TPA: hypothetical protein VNA15_04570 [Candidatus Angelobacter sp.]|nr:hypothetical protein [Candidatus Angelobacter sp.]